MFVSGNVVGSLMSGKIIAFITPWASFTRPLNGIMSN